MVRPLNDDRLSEVAEMLRGMAALIAILETLRGGPTRSELQAQVSTLCGVLTEVVDHLADPDR